MGCRCIKPGPSPTLTLLFLLIDGLWLHVQCVKRPLAHWWRDTCVIDACYLAAGTNKCTPLQGASASTLYRTAVGGHGETRGPGSEGWRLKDEITREKVEKHEGARIKSERGKKTERRNVKRESMRENKSKRPTSVTHYPPGPLSGNCSIWHNSQQTSLWLQMGVDGREGGGGKSYSRQRCKRYDWCLPHGSRKNTNIYIDEAEKSPLPQSSIPLNGNSSFFFFGHCSYQW